MQIPRPHLLALSLLAIGTPDVSGIKTPNDAILLSQVRTLTLRANAKTAHRLVPPIPQLTCKGPGCRFYEVDIMRCKNQGSAYNKEDIEWLCTANLPTEFKLGGTDVSCEGYSHPKDEYVLKGSCGVEYRLLLTDLGEEKYASNLWSFKGSGGERWPLFSTLFVLAFLAILIWIIYSAYRALPNANLPAGFWGRGGGDDGPWDPPPPYPGKRYTNGSGHQQTGWRPGFWSGALGGAAAGYLAGNRGARQQTIFPERDGWLSRSSRDNFTTPGASRSRSTRHESTGFGSTLRR